jgi:branched-chain amino acid transport system permease protein
MDFLNAFVALANFVIIPATAYGSAAGARRARRHADLRHPAVFQLRPWRHDGLRRHGDDPGDLGPAGGGITLGPLPTALLGAALRDRATGLLVLGTDRVVYRFYRTQKAKPIIFVIASIGVMFILNGIVRFIIGVDDQRFPTANASSSPPAPSAR